MIQALSWRHVVYHRTVSRHQLEMHVYQFAFVVGLNEMFGAFHVL